MYILFNHFMCSTTFMANAFCELFSVKYQQIFALKKVINGNGNNAEFVKTILCTVLRYMYLRGVILENIYPKTT